MPSLTIPITVNQLLELARQLSRGERRALLDTLLAERFDATLAASDRQSAPRTELTEDAIQAEVDAVRLQRREDRQRAAGR